MSELWDALRAAVSAIESDTGHMSASHAVSAAVTPHLPALLALVEAHERAKEPQHECVPVGVVDHCGPGRDWWIGRITKHVEGYEHETHCLHIVTPRKAFVLMVNAGDIAAIYCLLACAEPQPDPAWRHHQIDAYRRAAALRGATETRP